MVELENVSIENQIKKQNFFNICKAKKFNNELNEIHGKRASLGSQFASFGFNALCWKH